MINYFSLIYLGAGLSSLAVSLLVYRSYKKSGNRGQRDLSLTFGCMFFHAISLSLPVMIAPENLPAIAAGFIIGIVFVFLLFIIGLQVELSIARPLFVSYVKELSTVVAILGAVAINVLIFDFRLPYFQDGVIFWNVNPYIAWLIGGLSFLYGVIWSYMFFRSGGLTKNASQKTKMFVLSIDGLLIGIAALLVFTSTSVVQTNIGLLLFIVSTLTTAVILLVTRTK